ncbi:MAG TPA: dienelactone hydrolase family protein [Stenomitos sp.]
MSLNAIAYPNPPLAAAKARFIGLHGWGANAQDLASLAPYLQLNSFQYLFPDAPLPHPHVPGGGMWYDLSDLSKCEGLDQSRASLTQWLDNLEQTTEIPLNRTILTGFSQGGAMTLDVGSHFPLAGLVVLSGYLHPPTVRPLPKTFPPILMIHGSLDSVVPVSAARNARDVLTQAGAQVQYHELEMGHEIQPEVLKLMRDFITSLIP